MDHLHQSFSVNFEYKIYFTEKLFSNTNTAFSDFLLQGCHPAVKQKILFIVDSNVAEKHPTLLKQIDDFFSNFDNVPLISEKIIIPGGEIAKNDERYFDLLIDAIDRHGIDRHSYIAAIGGGAILDLTGYAAAVSHRGIKHIRIPTTVLSQNDSGVGVKNGVNYCGKKNFLGTFTPPVAVFNDSFFLTTLTDRHWLSGISEAVKVGLIKDAAFFNWIESNAELLVTREPAKMKYLIRRCAELHLEHIRGGDPFEFGSSRPLDFGHWSAHKLEQLSNFEVLHGEAVSIGIALDSIYSNLIGFLSEEKSTRILNLLVKLGLPVTHSLATANDIDSPLLKGLQEFREHLGGCLTIMLLKDIGTGIEVHEMDPVLISAVAKQLQSNFEKRMEINYAGQ